MGGVKGAGSYRGNLSKRGAVRLNRHRLSSAAGSPPPSSPPGDDGGFSSSWVDHQQHQLGPLQSTDETRREIQELPSARPPVEDDDEEESECN